MSFEREAKKKAKQLAQDFMKPKKKKRKPVAKKRSSSNPKFMKDL